MGSGVAKGEHVEIAGLTVQLDPMVVISRILMRQKLLFVFTFVAGLVLTAEAYLHTTKKYESQSQILIRYEKFQDETLQKAINLFFGFLGSDPELSVLLNELDLYPEIRAEKAYEEAIKKLRGQLKIQVVVQNITISFISPSPEQAQRVVAFTAERLLDKVGDLTEAPYTTKLAGVEDALAEVQARKRVADAALNAFRAKNPDIVLSMSEYGAAMVGKEKDADEAIKQAESELRAARATGTGKKTPAETKAPAEKIPPPPETDASARLDSLRAKLAKLSDQLTPNHPDILQLKAELPAAEATVKREHDAYYAAYRARHPVAAPVDPEKSKEARVSAAQSKLKEMITKKVQSAGAAIKKPLLQREWQDLSVTASVLGAEQRTLIEDKERILHDRRAAMTEFQQNFELLDRARLPEVPVEPDKKKFVGIGLFMSLALAVLMTGTREALRQTYVSASEFEEQVDMPVFAVLPPQETPK